VILRAAGAAIAMLCLALAAGLGWFVTGTPGSVYGIENEHPIAPVANPSAGPVIVKVEPGEGARAIGRGLEQVGVIRSDRLFEVLVALRGVGDQLQAGEYEFDRGTPAIEVVDRIAAGKTASRSVLIREGLRVEEVGDVLQAAGVVDKQAFLAALTKAGHTQPFLARVPRDTLEGYLFPARYEFSRNTAPGDVVDALLSGFQDNVADRLQLEGQAMSLDDVVTLASVVQREAGTTAEMPIIASVFLNRLRAGLPLQADPTVQYALASAGEVSPADGYWKKALTLDDLKVDSPYNTYANPGLPPGPIASPGLDALNAVVRPAQTDYLFFVAKGDGTHAFAATLEEHERNIQQYQQP